MHRGIFCETHVSNPNAFYVQQDRYPYSELWYRVSGPIWSPSCKFDHEK